MQAGYTILEHPSDIGIEARGSSLAEAFQQAAIALMSIVLDLETVEVALSKEIKIAASDSEQLLVKWLSEILYLYDGQHFVCKEFTIYKLDSANLLATLRGEYLSEIKHRTKLDVKAITYHQLFVKDADRGGIVRVFLDI
jgi:SHS2 domain-containing protein